MDALVTCMYNGLHGTRFGGRLNRDEMYRQSLTTLIGSGVPIHCFVPAADVSGHRDYFARWPEAIQFLPLELEEIPYHPRIQDIKARHPDHYSDIPWQQRCVEIMWGKFIMLERVLELAPSATHLYWIDAGLADANIISTKYIAPADLAARRLSEVGAAFRPPLFDRIRAFVGDRVLALKMPGGHHLAIPERYNAQPYGMQYSLIAGLFGGPRDGVAALCARFREKVEAILAADELYFEESIMTGIHADQPELFRTFTFDSFYHEGWSAFDPQQVNFSNFFDQMLDTPPTERLEFPWNRS
jgi:hypothetical protein